MRAGVAIAALVVSCGDSSSGPADAGDAGMLSDASDASVDGPPPQDAATCAPKAVSTVPPYRPAASNASACTSAMLEEFYGDCLLTSSTQDTCLPFTSPSADAAHKSCASCLVKPANSPTLGPLVIHPAFVSLNIAGCIELMDASGLDCAHRYSDAELCDDAACASCHITDDASFQQYLACAQAADTSVCASYAAGANACAAAESDGGAASACFVGATFHDSFLAVAAVFCSHAEGG